MSAEPITIFVATDVGLRLSEQDLSSSLLGLPLELASVNVLGRDKTTMYSVPVKDHTVLPNT